MTKIRLCVIGNSHIASLKLGWQMLSARHPNIDVTFFGSRGTELRTLRAEARRLIPPKNVQQTFAWTSGGDGVICVDDFDVFLVHGCFGIDTVVQKLNRLHFAPTDHVELKNEILLDIKKVIESSVAHNILALLKGYQVPVLLSPRPFHSEEVLLDSTKMGLWSACVDQQANLTPVGRLVLENWSNFLRSNSLYVDQPAETTAQGMFTKREYSTNAPRLRDGLHEKFPSSDYAHMNSEYGVRVLENVLTLSRSLAAELQDRTSEPRKFERTVNAMHPYSKIPEKSHWRRSVENRDGQEIREWYKKKFPLSGARIATAGSCFAQHIGRRLRRSGFHFLDTEPAPTNLPPGEWGENGFGMYSARFGNIYTSRQLLQLFERAFGEFSPKESAWNKNGGYVDPFRPTIQPAPFSSINELVEAKEAHLSAVRELFSTADVFVFTLGLTETWESLDDGAVFPVAPGVAGGTFDPERYRFLNLGFNDVFKDMKSLIAKVRGVQPKMKFLLTVSPVPLMATASGEHVVTATTYSKAVLRAVAGQLATRRFIDYFPSYEIITSHVMGGRFYEEDKRSVSEAGVDYVMQQFFAEHQPLNVGNNPMKEREEDDDVLCDEALLDAFGAPNS